LVAVLTVDQTKSPQGQIGIDMLDDTSPGKQRGEPAGGDDVHALATLGTDALHQSLDQSD